MDPLSIAASVLAIIQTGESVIRLSSKARLYLNVPRDIDAIINEVSDLRVVLDDIQRKSKDIVQEDATHLLGQLARCKGVVLELEYILREALKLPTKEWIPFQSQFYRLRWVQKKDQVAKLKERLSSAKSTLTLQILISTYSDHFPSASPRRDEPELIPTELDPGQITGSIVSVRKYLERQEDISSIEPAYSVHLASDGSSEWGGQPNRRGLVFNPSAPKKQKLCFQNCECNCHRIFSNHLKLFGGLLGTIITTQTGSPLSIPLCRKQCGLVSTPRTSLTWYPPRQWQTDFVSILFANGCRSFVSLSFPKLVPPDSEFCVAIRAGDLGRVQEQLRSGQASVADIVAPYGLTPLSLAILYGQGELCQLLIREGANLFRPDHTWLISDLQDFFLGFSLCRSSISARALLQDIVRRSSSQEQMAALRMCMLEPGFGAFSFPRLHKSVLGLTTQSLDNLATISRLRINELDITGRAALHWAVYNEDVSSIHTLIHCGSDASIRDHEGVTPLHIAASLGSVTCMQTLLRAGADPHSGDGFGLTPLHHAAAQGHEEAIRLLITAGASWSAQSVVAEIPIAYAIYAGHSNAVEVLLECGSSLECKDRYGYTSILDATFTDSHQSLDALTRMAQVGAKLFDGKTILHIAAANSDAKTIEILQNARLTGVDIDAVDNAGFTAMQYIRRRGDGEELVEPFGALLMSVTPEVREPFEDLTEDSEEFFDAFEF